MNKRARKRTGIVEGVASRRIAENLVAVSLLLLALTACASFPGVQVFKYERSATAKGYIIPNVPSELWLERNYCGPACLSMVLNYWAPERDFNQKTIAGAIYDAAQQASYNSEMVLYPRLHGFASYSFQGDLETLRAVLEKDIPVIVLTRPIKQIGKGHYRVVIGIDDERSQVIFHDPLFGGRRTMTVKDFLKVWDLGADRNRYRWMMAVVPESRDFPFPALRDDPVTLVNLATAYYRRSEWAKSREYWEKARAALPQDPAPLYSLGMLSLREDKFEEAELRAREALRLDDTSAYALDVLGLAQAKQGKMLESFETLARALRLAPGEDFIRKHYLQVRALYIDGARAGKIKSKDKEKNP